MEGVRISKMDTDWSKLNWNPNKPMGEISGKLLKEQWEENHSVKDFVRVSPYGGDWEAWYLDGKLIAEGHSVRVSDILSAIADIFPNRVSYMEISDDAAEYGFEKDLSDLIARTSE